MNQQPICDKNWRLKVEPEGEGFYNMAADQALFLNYSKTHIPILRIYSWKKPFITLGINQDPVRVLTANNYLDFTHRITGGAAILHDQELTYSLVCSPQDLNLPSKVKESYKVICRFLIDFYSQLGLPADFAQNIFAGKKLGDYGNFCFSSFEDYDLVIKGKKIGGNAQRRAKAVIFQHGSIPISLDHQIIESCINVTDGLADKTTSLKSLGVSDCGFAGLSLKLAESFSRVFGVNFLTN